MLLFENVEYMKCEVTHLAFRQLDIWSTYEILNGEKARSINSKITFKDYFSTEQIEKMS